MTPPDSSETPRPAPIWPIALGLVALAVMVAFRENQGFWKQPDPSTAWTRPLVQFGYYPTILLVGSAIVRSIFLSDRTIRARSWFKLWLATVCLSGILVYGFANNLLNYLDGRPVHYHAPGVTAGLDTAAP